MTCRSFFNHLHMKLVKIFTFSAIILLLSVQAQAQKKHTAEADTSFARGFYYNAIEQYKKAYTVEKKANEKARLIFMVAESYRMLGDPKQMEAWYTKANKAQYGDPISYYYIGEALKDQGKYADAIVQYNKYKDKKPGDLRVDAAIHACEMAQSWVDEPTRYKVDAEVLVNSAQYDYSPTFADKRNDDIIFSSTRNAATGAEIDAIGGENFADLFITERDKNGKWSEPVKLGATINTEAHEGSAVLNKKRSVIYFTRCPVEKKELHGCDIWMAKKAGQQFNTPIKLKLKPEVKKGDSQAAQHYVVGHPALSDDGKTLFYVSNMPAKGAQGGRDIWRVGLDKQGMIMGDPVNLGSDVNTSKDERYPFVKSDGTLLFTSDGHLGMGGWDIFMAEKLGENEWGNVTNMRYPINSSMDDFGIVFDGENDRGFFTSNRPGGKGQDDIWSFRMPDLVFGLQGSAILKEDGTALVGVIVSLLGSDGTSYSALTDDLGGFSFIENGDERYIKENTTYAIKVEKECHLNATDQISTVGLEESTTFVKEYILAYVCEEGIVELPEVRYDLAKWDLQVNDQVNSKDSLEVLYKTLIDNPTIIIELRSHTDSRDTDQRNQVLSEKRAQSCVDYLISKGIDPVRLTAVGVGESELKISDAEIAKMSTREEKEAMHQKNRRTDFKVLSWDYIPPDSEETGDAGEGSDTEETENADN